MKRVFKVAAGAGGMPEGRRESRRWRDGIGSANEKMWRVAA